MAFSVFSAKHLSRRSRLSRTSRAPSRLIRPRPIDCDAGPEETVKIFPFFYLYFCFNIAKRKFFQKFRHLALINTPKEAHGRIFVSGGSFFARQLCWQKKACLGAASLYRVLDLVTIYTPKEAHSRICVTGRSVFARRMGFQKNAFLGAASLYLYCICLRECIKLDTNTDTPARWSRGNLTHPSSVENVTSLSNPSSQGSAESESNFAQCTAEPYPQQAPCSHSPALARKKIRMQRYMGETGVYQIGEGLGVCHGRRT